MNISNGLKIKGIQVAAVIFLIILIVLIWQIINIYPEIGILQDKIKAQEIVVKDSEDTLKRLKEFVSFAAKNKETISKFDFVLPAGEDKANLISNMDSFASANGLSILKVSFDEKNTDSAGEQQAAADAAPKNSDFDSININLSLRGSYSSFKNFLNAVEKNLRVTDVVTVDFSGSSASGETAEENKAYAYNIELKTYLYKPAREENIANLLSGRKFKNFSVKNLDFIKEKAFSDLFLSPDYNINAGADEIGNQKIF